MTNRPRLLVWLAAGSAAVAMSAHAAQAAPSQPELRRFALIVGANDGGTDRVTLRYAGSDARSIATVLAELGGVAPTDTEVLVDPGERELEDGFVRVERALARARASGARVELVVYYSGHSDEDGLLLGGVRYPYSKLRARIRAMPADVNIAILDSCASGAFTRTKGGTRRPPFMIDESTRVRGHAFLSSSTADEAAQESDRIGGSFFTHYLVSGLRGAADINRDGRVTLSEAYQFAFDATVARTETTRYGAQHPGYDMHLVGTGDVVMTDLRATNAALVVEADVEGTLYVRDADGRLIVELTKLAGRPIVLGLSPRRYRVVVVSGGQHRGAEVVLGRGARVSLAASQLSVIAPEHTMARGEAPGATLPVVGDQPRRVPFQISLVPWFGTGRPGAVHSVSINLLIGASAGVDGVEIGGLANLASGPVEGAQIAGLFNTAAGPVNGAQVAGLANIATGSVSGGQVSGLVNLASGRLDGAQVGGLANVATGGGDGTQVAGLGNIASGRFDGVQIGGLGNIASGRVGGVQIGGLANVARGVEGLQLSGLGNLSRGAVEGVQISGGLNAARRLDGVQVGLVNIGHFVDGAQIGLVNIARRVDGIQAGLVNVASEDGGAPLGLVNLIEGGYRAVEVWTSDIAPVSAGIKLGGSRVYTMIAATANETYFMPGLGFGIHFPGDGYYVDVDATVHSLMPYAIAEPEESLHGQLRGMVGLRLSGGLAVFAGVTMQATLDFDETYRPLTLFKEKAVELDGAVLRLHPGVMVGLAY